MFTKKTQWIFIFALMLGYGEVSEASWARLTQWVGSKFSRQSDNAAQSKAGARGKEANSQGADGAGANANRQIEMAGGGSGESNFRIEDALEVITPFSGYRGGRTTTASVVSKLMRKTKAAVVLVAPAGSGKSEFFRHLKHLIETQDPSVRPLHNQELIYLNPKSLMGNTSHRGEYEGRLDQLLRYLKDESHRGKTLVIDELQELFNSGEMGNQLLDTLKPYLTSNMPVKLVFGITPQPYRKHMTDPQLVRRLQPVFFQPPSVDVVRLILQNAQKSMEIEDGMRFSPEQMEGILRITSRQSRLANPDAALTVMENAKNLARKALGSDTLTIDRLRERLEQVQGKILRLENLRRDDYGAYFGPHYDRQLERLKREDVTISAALRAYDQAFEDTRHLREQLENLIEQRARSTREIQQQASARVQNDDLASPMPFTENLDGEIEKLSRQIGERTQVLQTLDVSDEQIILAARDQLQLDETMVRSAWGGAAGTQQAAKRVSEKLHGEHEAVVQAIASGVRTQRTLQGARDQQVPAFLVLGPEPNEAEAIARASAREFTGLDPYRIDGRTITAENSMSTHLGSNPGYVGYVEGVPGPFLEYVQRANGNVGLTFSHIDQGHNSVRETLNTILESGHYTANTGDVVDFRNSFIVASLRDRGTSEARNELSQQLGHAQNELERQALLRQYVINHHPTVSEDLLRRLQIVQLENTGDMRLHHAIEQKLSSQQMTEAFGENLGMSLKFNEDFIQHLAQMARRQGGDQEINALIRTEVVPFISRQIDEGQLVQGDVATLGLNSRGHYELQIEPWAVGGRREQSLQSLNPTDSRRQGSSQDEALEALTEALRLMD